jgi:transmembrane sensor
MRTTPSRPTMDRASAATLDRLASELLARRDSDNWSALDEEQLQDWLSSSAGHRVAFLRAELAWENMGRLGALGAGVRSERPPPVGRWNLSPFFESPPSQEIQSGAGGGRFPPPAVRRQTRLTRLAAASLVIAIVAGTATWYRRLSANTYTTPVGGMESVSMLDGSTVTLNTDSRIQVVLTRTERRIDLTRGEAFVEVAKEASRPFIVEVGAKRVVAVGTKFSVRRNAHDVEVVVTEGKVRVDGPSAPLHIGAIGSRNEMPSAAADGAIFLTSGAVARIGDAGVLVSRKSIPDAEAELSWRTGILTFRDETLAEAIAEFNRYSSRKVVIVDSQVAGLRIGGNFRKNNVEAFLELLQEGYPVKVIEEPDRFVLTSK